MAELAELAALAEGRGVPATIRVSGVVPAGASAELGSGRAIVYRDGGVMRGERRGEGRVFVPSSLEVLPGGFDFVIEQIRVGGAPQLVGSAGIPAEAFAASSLAPGVQMDALHHDGEIVIAVYNTSDVERTFTAIIEGDYRPIAGAA